MNNTINNEEQNKIQITDQPENKSHTPRECWICMTEDARPFLRPCLCRGSTKYVHTDCFESYIKTKNLKNFRCNFCKVKYRIEIPFKFFIISYEMLSHIIGHICTWIFIISVATITYTLLFLYGITVIVFFVGLVNLDIYFLREISFFLYVFRLLKLAVGAPLLPIYLCLSMNHNFSLISHFCPLLLLIDGLSFKCLKLYAIVLFFYLYCRLIQYVQIRMGHVPLVLGGIIINNHPIAINEVVFSLSSPFLGSFVGKALFNFKKPARDFAGMLLVFFLKDITRIVYLLCRKRFINTIRVLEYTD